MSISTDMHGSDEHHEGRTSVRTVVLRSVDSVSWEITYDLSHPLLRPEQAPFN